MQEELFLKVWGVITSRFPSPTYPNQSVPKRQDAEEVYGVLYNIAPSLAENLQVAASWVIRTVRDGPGVLTDLAQLETLARIEFFAKASELLSVITVKEIADIGGIPKD